MGLTYTWSDKDEEEDAKKLLEHKIKRELNATLVFLETTEDELDLISKAYARIPGIALNDDPGVDALTQRLDTNHRLVNAFVPATELLAESRKQFYDYKKQEWTDERVVKVHDDVQVASHVLLQKRRDVLIQMKGLFWYKVRSAIDKGDMNVNLLSG